MRLVQSVLLSNVLLHICILRKPHSAPGAHVGLHTTVQQLVAHKVVFKFELLMADITGVFSFRLMIQFVPVQGRSLSESLSTVVTHVRFLPTMYV